MWRRSLVLGLMLGGAFGAWGQLPPGTQDANATQTAGADPQAGARAAANEALDQGNYAGALKLLRRMAEQSPKDARLLYDMGYAEDALDQRSEAESSYRAAIAADGTLMEAHLGLGLLLARTGQAEARDELARAAQASDGAPLLRARAFRAMARLDMAAKPARGEDARQELLEALKLSPETAEDTLMAAELAEAANDLEGAEKEYRRVLASRPQDPAATAALAHLLAGKDPVEAQALLTAALAAHPGDAALTAQLVTLYGRQGRYSEALPLAEAMHAASPLDGNVTRLLAHLYSESGEPAKAEPLYAGLLSVNPNVELMDDRADALIKLRRYAEAETLLQRAVSERTSFATPEGFGVAASHLAFAAANNNDPQTVLHALELRATVLPQSPSALFLAATAYDKLHDYKQAADKYKEFLAAASGKFPDEEFEARHRLIAIEKRH